MSLRSKVMAWGTVADHAELEKAIRQIREGDPDQQPTVKAYALPGREVRTLLYMRSVLTELVPSAAISVDGRGGSIVASATPEDHEKLKQAIDEIVKLDSSDSFQLEVYSCQRITAAQASAALRPIVPDAQIDGRR